MTPDQLQDHAAQLRFTATEYRRNAAEDRKAGYVKAAHSAMLKAACLDNAAHYIEQSVFLLVCFIYQCSIPSRERG